MIVERRLGDADGVGDLLHRDIGEAARLEEDAGDLDEVIARGTARGGTVEAIVNRLEALLGGGDLLLEGVLPALQLTFIAIALAREQVGDTALVFALPLQVRTMLALLLLALTFLVRGAALLLLLTLPFAVIA